MFCAARENYFFPRMIARGIVCALLAGVQANERAATVEAGFWDIWGEWGNCTAACGEGIRNRSRECVDETGSGEDDLLAGGEHVDLQCIGQGFQYLKNGHNREWTRDENCVITPKPS